jgi:hypothetical protein
LINVKLAARKGAICRGVRGFLPVQPRGAFMKNFLGNYTKHSILCASLVLLVAPMFGLALLGGHPVYPSGTGSVENQDADAATSTADKTITAHQPSAGNTGRHAAIEKGTKKHAAAEDYARSGFE